jgi:hypothetical protein
MEVVVQVMLDTPILQDWKMCIFLIYLLIDCHGWLQFEGRHIRVDRAAAVSKGTAGGGTQVIYDSARSVFVGNLPFDTQVSFFILEN